MQDRYPTFVEFLYRLTINVQFVCKESENFPWFVCPTGKNGVYCDLVKNVREAFEECELVRINCEGVNGSDYRRIGAKLKVW
jgi:RNA-binding protein YhbY